MPSFSQLEKVISAVINWTNEERTAFFAMLQVKNYKAGEYIVRKGETSEKVFFFNKGLAANISVDQNGNDFPVNFTFENDQTCNFIGFLKKTFMVSSLLALEDVECVVIPHAALHWMYENVKEGDKFGRVQFQRIILLLVKSHRLFYIKDPLKRYSLMQQIFPGIEKRVSQRLISSFLKIDQAHFSRLKTAIDKK